MCRLWCSRSEMGVSSSLVSFWFLLRFLLLAILLIKCHKSMGESSSSYFCLLTLKASGFKLIVIHVSIIKKNTCKLLLFVSAFLLMLLVNISCGMFRSANIGVFICLKCCGVHRSLGTHISKVTYLVRSFFSFFFFSSTNSYLSHSYIL